MTTKQGTEYMYTSLCKMFCFANVLTSLQRLSGQLVRAGVSSSCKRSQKKQNAYIAKQQFFMRLTYYQSAFTDDCSFKMATSCKTVDQQRLTANPPPTRAHKNQFCLQGKRSAPTDRRDRKINGERIAHEAEEPNGFLM